MEKVVSLCVILVLTIGMIGYGLLNVSSQYEDVSDTIGSDASALNLRVNDGSIIGKEEVIRYFNNLDKLGYEFHYESYDVSCFVVPNKDSTANKVCKQIISKDLESLSSRAMFKLSKHTGIDGKVARLQVVMIDQSK